MENHLQMMLLRNLLHENHEHHVLVDCLGSLTENRCTLKLVRRNLVVTGLQKDAKLICLGLEILHKVTYS